MLLSSIAGAELDTDLGSENGTMATIQAFFRDDGNTQRLFPLCEFSV